ncbi:phage portal protein [Comamonadaceae bacterium OH3737_COT-264]|nr:phage portal protein [Comamonadaceae bacterium OH3737_COT-264]
MFDWFRRTKPEQRSQAIGSSYTALAMLAHAEAITDAGADLSGVVAGCANLWANGLSMATTDSQWLTPEVLASMGRQLATEGNSVWYISPDGLVPVSDYDLTTSAGKPRAYRLSVPEIHGGTNITALAGEVLHIRIGADARSPWQGVAPLRRASISAGLLNATEVALAEVFRDAPIGSKVLGMPETSAGANSKLAHSFKGKHGRVLVRDSSTVYAGAQGAPDDWRPADMTPNLRDSMALESLKAAREAVLHVYGVLPVLMSDAAAGPVIREAQRHLATWTLAPIAKLIAHEVQAKTGEAVSLDVFVGLGAYDAGGAARAMATIVDALAAAKAAGLTPGEVLQAGQIAGVFDA